jgi:hypothetical protein
MMLRDAEIEIDAGGERLDLAGSLDRSDGIEVTTHGRKIERLP